MKCSISQSIAFKTVIISSLFVPVAGLVTLRVTSEVIYGQPFTLVCYTTYKSALYATFYRYERASDIGIDDLSARLGTVSGSTCQPDSLSLTRYNFSCSSDGKEISLIVPAENLMEHNTIWKCTNAEGPIMSANNNVTIFVNVPVSSLQLRPYGIVNINEFETNTFTCITGFCRPPAILSWWKNNVNITNTADMLTSDQNYTIGSLNYTGNRLHNGHIIVCKASNGYGVERTAQQGVLLNIQYAPDGSPSIGNYSNGSIFSIIENTPETLSCSITGGNPLASLFWNCFGLVGSINTVEQTVTSNIILNVNRDREGLPCQCLSVHELQDNRTTIILLQILYGAGIVNLSAQESNTVNENSSVSFRCFVDSNPLPNITWRKEDNNTVLMTESGVLQSHFLIESAQCLDMDNYSCTAYNGIRTPANETLQLFVRCHPRLDVRLPLKTKIYAKHHTAVVLRYTVISYPLPTFTWTFIGNGSETRYLPASASQLDSGQQSELRFTSLGIDDFGNYSVIANNSLYPSAKEVFEIIPGDVPAIPSNVTVIDRTSSSVTIQWVAGYSGGLEQTFHIIASAGEFTRSVIASDPGYMNIGTAVLENLLPKTKYTIYMTANNSLGASNMIKTIVIETLEETRKQPSSDNGTGSVIIGSVLGACIPIAFIVMVVVVLYRRRRLCNNGKSTDQSKTCRSATAEGTNIEGYTTINTVASTGGENDKNPYLGLQDMAGETNESVNIRSSDTVTYVALHPYANNEDHAYSSLNQRPHNKGEKSIYENMKRSEWS